MLQMQTSARANFTGACVKADIKLGWDKYRARDFHLYFMTHHIPETRHEHQVQGHLSFARTIGLDAPQPEWNFPVSEEATGFVNTVIPVGERVLLVSPCSSLQNRNWLVERYTAVANYAVKQHGMTIVLSGGGSELERSIGETIASMTDKQVINLIGKLSLLQLTALLKRADVVLTPDSGPMHLANALGTVVIGLHASTWPLRSGPYNSLDLCVDKFTEAALQFRNKKPENLRWGTRIKEKEAMSLIEVDEVISRLDLAIKRFDTG
jgi:heptosyltransferase I